MNRVFRYWIFIIFFSFCFLLCIIRSTFLTFSPIVPFNSNKKELKPIRGTIYANDFRELAISLESFSVGIHPQKVKNPENLKKILYEVLKIPYPILNKKIKSNKNFLWIKRQILSFQAEKLRKHQKEFEASALILKKDNIRIYPDKTLASHVLGFVGVDHVGLSGLEYLYNEELSTPNHPHEIKGKGILLTINPFIQYHVESILKEAVTQTKAKSAIAIVSNVHSGDILAMVSLPNFNPNYYLDYPNQSKINRTISLYYEPGSTFKIMTLAGIIQHDAIIPNAQYCCPGIFRKGKIYPDCPSSHKMKTLVDAIQQSCNTAIIQASLSLSNEQLYNFLNKLGFGKNTGIDLPGEIPGVLHHYKKWDQYLRSYIPIGHGVGVTPLQLVTAANSLVNGGFYYVPKVVSQIVDSKKKIIETKATQTSNVYFTQEHSKKLLSYLQAVVNDKKGTGYLANIPGFSITGKTGTTIKFDGTEYQKGKYIASFLGFFPGKDPEVSVLIFIDEAQGEKYAGGEIAAPIFKKVIEKISQIIYQGKIFQVENLKPITLSPNLSMSPNHMPNLLQLSKKEVLSIIWKHYPGPHLIFGAGYLKYQDPTPGVKITSPYKFTLEFDFPKFHQ